MGALVAAVGIKDLVYGVLIAALLAYGGFEVHHLKAEGAAHELAALKASSDKLTAQNTAALAAKDAEHAAALKKLGDDYNANLAASKALAITIIDGLQRNAGGGKATVPGHTAAPVEPTGPSRISGGVEGAVEGLVRAAGDDADKVIALQAYVTNVCLK